MSLWDAELLARALDDPGLAGSFSVLDELVEYYGPEPPLLVFNAPSMAVAVSSYGKTVFASPGPVVWRAEDMRDQGVDLRRASLVSPTAFPASRFGVVYVRWPSSLAGAVLPNLIRWLRPGGVLLLEVPDAFPVSGMPEGPYARVARAVVERLGVPSSVPLAGRLLRHGLGRVGVRCFLPDPGASRELLGGLMKAGAPWPGLTEADVRDWPHDPVASVPMLASVAVWGVKA